MAKRKSWLKKTFIGDVLMKDALMKRKVRRIEYANAFNNLNKTIVTNGLRLNETELNVLRAMNAINLGKVNGVVKSYMTAASRQLALDGCFEFFRKNPGVLMDEFVLRFVEESLKKTRTAKEKAQEN